MNASTFRVDFPRGGYYDNHMNTDTFGERLRGLREARKIGVRELARRSGVNHATLSLAERNQRWVDQLPSIEVLEKLADALEVTLDELRGTKKPAPKQGASLAVTGAGYATGSAELQQLAEIGRSVVQLVNERRNIIRGPQIRAVPDVFRVPVVNGMSATALASEISQVEQWIEVPASLLNGATRPAAYVIVGDCLWDRWGIKTGDTLIIDLANTDPRDGQIVAARINDAEETAKEFHRVANGVDLKPTTKGYSTIEVRVPDQLLIIGVYVTHLVTGKR